MLQAASGWLSSCCCACDRSSGVRIGVCRRASRSRRHCCAHVSASVMMTDSWSIIGLCGWVWLGMFGTYPGSGAPGAFGFTKVRLVLSRFTLPSTAANVLPWAADICVHLCVGAAVGRIGGAGGVAGLMRRGTGRGTAIALGRWNWCSMVGAMTMSWRKSK